MIFATYWSGLRAGIISTALVIAYIPIAANFTGSSLYGLTEIERRMIFSGIVFAVFALLTGLVQNKLRSMAIKAWDAQESADKEAKERQLIEERLSFSENLRNVVVDAALDSIIAIDLYGNVTLWNKSAETLFGWTSEEILGKLLSDYIIPSLHRGGHLNALERFRETGVAHILNQRMEISAVDKHGREFDVELSIVAHEVPAETAFIGFIRDISEQNRMKSELMTSQRLESIGQLAGGIAHDFNNVLNAIIGFSQLAKSQIPDDHPAQEDLDQVLEAGRRSSDINNQLLSFARKQISTPQVGSLNEIILGMEAIFRTLIRADIEYRVVLAPDVWTVRVDPGQIEQMLTNLVINARDAMPECGSIVIETVNTQFTGEEDFYLSDLKPGDYATLSVSDTGSGISEENLQRIFEPFFTTKQDKGTGLGLASAYGTVKQAGGRIAVYSELGHGTTFTIYLPRAEGTVESRERVKAPSSNVTGTETILVAEDNDAVRKLFQQALTKYGYNVLIADSGQEALKVALDFDDTIDVLVTDLIMPKMGGVELAKKLRKARPQIKVLFLSGYTEEAITRDGVSGVEGSFLQKPVLPTDLAAKIRLILASPLGQDSSV